MYFVTSSFRTSEFPVTLCSNHPWAPLMIADIIILNPLRCAQVAWRFSEFACPGMEVSDDRQSATRSWSVGHSVYESVLLEPAFDSSLGRYVEWSLDHGDPFCQFILGVTALEAAPSGAAVWTDPLSRVFCCHNSSVWPRGSAPLSWNNLERRLTIGDRVGLLVIGGRAWVFVNGEKTGGGPMAERLPQSLRFLAGASCQGSRIGLVTATDWGETACDRVAWYIKD